MKSLQSPVPMRLMALSAAVALASTGVIAFSDSVLLQRWIIGILPMLGIGIGIHIVGYTVLERDEGLIGLAQLLGLPLALGAWVLALEYLGGAGAGIGILFLGLGLGAALLGFRAPARRDQARVSEAVPA